MVEKSSLPIFIVGTAGVEIAQFAPSSPENDAVVHVAQSWTPTRCPCGEVHLPCAPAMLAVLVGPPQAHVHLDPAACALAISPDDSPWNLTGVSQVVGPARDFGPWAAQVVSHVISGPTRLDVFCFSLADVVTVLRPPRRVHFARAASQDGVVAAATRLIAATPWLSSDVRSLILRVHTKPYTTLTEIGDAADLVARRAPNADVYLYTPMGPEAPEVSVLGS